MKIRCEFTPSVSNVDIYTDGESQTCLLNAFEPVTVTEIGILLKSSSVKSCELDPIPTWLLRYCAHDIIPVLTTIVNMSLTIERVVAARLSAHMSECNLCVPNQSAYKPNHSVETALVCVQNDILRAMDNQNIVIMLLLDLSAAFDTVDHNVMLHRLTHDVGVGQTALKWFKSYMSDRVQAVHINGTTSPARPLTCGVPQGFVLGPQLFSIYAAPVSKIIRNNLLSHFYADDTQIYITVKPHQEDIDAAVESIEQCVTEIRSWMKTNSLKLNDSKTEVIVYGSAQQLKKFTLQSLRVGDCVVRVTDCVRNLGVQFDAEMTMESHVTAVCKSAIFHLRNISRIRRYLTAAATEQIVHAFVTSRLDIGNALLYRLPLKQTQRLRKIQNWAARLIDGAMRYSHATPLLKKLHWLPIAVRVEFKILLLTHRALNGQAPNCIGHCVSRRQPVRSLRSSEHSLLCVPRTRRHWSDRAFSVAAPSLWNALPYHLTLSPMSTARFKVKLKTYLFTRTFCTAL